ncbi:MAG: hypothetical protein PHC50_03080 [Candidatus Cloacimonetes bacterium]|nr:hypothetical protein [Candidatus Cloacimonadota bacterium]
MPLKWNRKSAYAISIAIHILILSILAFLYYQPAKTLHWHQFEWMSTEAPEPPAQISAQEASGGDAQSEQAIKPLQGSSKARSNPQVAALSSPLIESPVIDTPSSYAIAPPGTKRGEYNGALSALGDLAQGGRPGSGYNASLVSGAAEAYIISQTAPTINPIMDDEILIDFQLSESGRVQMNSVQVQSYKAAVHWDAIRKEMPNWRFGFKGVYKAERVYRIRVVFRVK